MAQLHSNFSFTGRFGNISAYRMKGSDKIILRTRGGASKEKIKRDPRFENQRRSYTEFGGRSTASKYLRAALFPLNQLADYNFAGTLNALVRPIQLLDTAHEPGKRDIYFTGSPKLMEGFSLNRRNPFDSIVRNPLTWEMHKDTLSARINIPALIPGINFFATPGNHPLYNIVVVLGIVPDIEYTVHGYYPRSLTPAAKSMNTAWYPLLSGSPATVLEVSLPAPASLPPSNAFSMMLSVGIRFGTVIENNDVRQVKYAGAAKILAME